MSERLATRLITGESTSLTVFLHGLMGRGKNFTQTALALKPVTSSLLIDLPNHGSSPWTAEFNYRDMAAAVVETVQAKLAGLSERPQVHLVGHSMGGKVAMFAALLHPELFASLTVVDISPVAMRENGGSFDTLLGALRDLPLASLPSRQAAHEILLPHIPEQSVRDFLLQNLQRETGGGWSWQPNLELLYSSLPEIMDFAADDLAPFTGDVLWVAGGDSPYIRAHHFPLMQHFFPRVQPVTIPGANHWVHASKPAEFQRELAEFIAVKAGTTGR
ncbi:MAG: alpha/beta fold hydrolase [Microbacteriaceae bacterium]|nr:alpha/beta fold hydrolase [Microbacteriaceae bacterium]